MQAALTTDNRQPPENSATEVNPASVQERTANRTGNYSEWIDILRGFAAMWVIVYHSRVALWVGFHEIRGAPGTYSALDRLLAWFSFPAACGGSAVMLFFLISGFCIHLPYAANNRPFNIKEYSIRRAFRILPPYLLAVVLTCGLEWLTYSLGGRAPTSWDRVMRVALLSQNYGQGPGQMLSGQMLTNGSLWSLPVEIELYIAYLLFFLMLKSIKGTVTAIIVSTVSLIATIAFIHNVPNLGGNFAFFWIIWCAGAFFAEGFKQRTLPKFRWWNGLTLLALTAICAWGESIPWHLGYMTYLWSAFYFHIIWWALLNPGVLTKFPERLVKLLVWAGTISYSAYLIHGPLFAFYGFLWERWMGAKPASFVIPMLFSLSIWPVAWVFWKGCELPFHQMSQRLAKKVK